MHYNHHKSLLAISGFLLLAASTLATSPKDPCALPLSLQTELAKSYPGKTLVHLSDLDDYDKKLFRKDHGSRCPGVAKVNFYGDGKPTFALVLISGENPKREAHLILAHQAANAWEIRLLETTDGTPVVWREGPGKYDGLYEPGTIYARHPVIVFCGYESWAIVYAWTGKEVQKIWVSD